MLNDFTKSTLNYPVNADTPVRRVRSNRAPTANDYGGFTTGDEWFDEASNDWYKFSRKTGAGALWARIGGTSSAIEEIAVDAASGSGTNPVVGNASNEVTFTGEQLNGGSAANALEVRSNSANTVTFGIQRALTAPTADTTANGIAHFDSSHFSIDANGFVQLAGGGLAVDELTVQAIGGTGVNPVTPSASGNITLGGTAVAPQAIPIRTISNAVNNIEIEVQRATSSASTNTTAQGICSFSSVDFSVDANAFVTRAQGIRYTPTLVSSSPTNLSETDEFVAVLLTAAPITVNLPAAPTSGTALIIKDVNGLAATHNITIDGNGANIDGAATQSMSSNFESVSVVFNGTVWSII